MNRRSFFKSLPIIPVAAVAFRYEEKPPEMTLRPEILDRIQQSYARDDFALRRENDRLMAGLVNRISR